MILHDCGADPNAAGENNLTPLHEAVRGRWNYGGFDLPPIEDFVEVVELLISAGADPSRKTRCYETPLDLLDDKVEDNPMYQLLKRYSS